MCVRKSCVTLGPEMYCGHSVSRLAAKAEWRLHTFPATTSQADRQWSNDHISLRGESRACREMGARVVLFTEYCPGPFGETSNRSNPNACRAATLTSEKRAHVCQDGVRQVEYHLEGSYSEKADGETGGEPLGVG